VENHQELEKALNRAVRFQGLDQGSKKIGKYAKSLTATVTVRGVQLRTLSLR
jgi:hypothetical protein